MKDKIVIEVSKMARKASRMLGKGGGDIPGRITRKAYPELLKELAKNVENIIVITGTNGKTTTSNLLAKILKEAGFDIINNSEGNNLITGITSSFVINAKSKNKLNKDYKYAVLEVDEANMPKVVAETNPKYMIVNNFFRDQLNRYGEIDTIVEKVKGSAKNSNAKLILNADDPFVMRIGLLDNEKVFFGLTKDAYKFDQYSMNESKFCPTCGTKLEYDHVHYGQLGFYKCKCGFERGEAKYEVTGITDDMKFQLGGETYKLGIDGTYNVYNALGAIACAKEMGIPDEAIKRALSEYKVNNGRMQTINVNGTKCMLNLAKNQVGADISISEMVKDKENKKLLFLLNDLAHDSADISWIWDADFERLVNTPIEKVVCSGTRAEDMALRIKYAGVPANKIVVINNLEKAVNAITEDIEENGAMKAYCLPTYTGLEPMRKYLESKVSK